MTVAFGPIESLGKMTCIDIYDQIDSGPEKNIRVILKALVADSSATQKKVESFLEQLREAQSTTAARTKRNAEDEDYAICTECQSVFAVDENTDTSCHFHDGNAQVAYLILSKSNKVKGNYKSVKTKTTTSGQTTMKTLMVRSIPNSCVESFQMDFDGTAAISLAIP